VLQKSYDNSGMQCLLTKQKWRQNTIDESAKSRYYNLIKSCISRYKNILINYLCRTTVEFIVCVYVR